MNNIDSELKDLNEVIKEIEARKLSIKNNENKITSLDAVVVFDVIAISGAAIVSSASCCVLQLANILSNDKCFNALSVSIGGALVICGISNVNDLIKNMKLKKEIESSKKAIDYLDKVYEEKKDKLSDFIINNSNQMRALKKDN